MVVTVKFCGWVEGLAQRGGGGGGVLLETAISCWRGELLEDLEPEVRHKHRVRHSKVQESKNLTTTLHLNNVLGIYPK